MATIDERVVQMRFDNKQFESGAQQTMSTLDKLKEKLSFNGIASKASAELDKMGDSTDTISVKFDAMSVVAISALNRITNAAMNAGSQMIKSLTIAPISQGWDEYELKMGSVQTIMASTGAALEEVNGYLEELNVYADRTIYSFADMTNNIGKFTNSGVKLKDAVKAIQGISNEAALSGANANEASRAMYNFAQALSSGAVRLIDWKSIENANMATVEFKEELIKTAVELGTVVEREGMYISTTTDLNGSISDAFNATKGFNDSLSAQWMTTDVLVETLGRYADETTDLGKRAFAAAQDVKTFSQLMDTLKEAVGSGWAQTWEIIFGDFEEAKKLWTGVSNVIGGFIDAESKARNELLQGWKDLGGRTILIDAIGSAFDNVVKIVSALRQALEQVFPPVTAKQLTQATKAVREFVQSLEFSDEAIHTLAQAFKLLLLPVQVFVQAVRIAITVIKNLVPMIFSLVDSLLALPTKLGGVSGALKSVLGDERYIRFTTALSNAVKTLGGIFVSLGKAIVGVIAGVGNLAKSKLGESFNRLAEILKPIAGWLMDKVIEGLERIANFDYSKITGWAEDGLSFVIDQLSDVIEFAGNAAGAIINFFKGFTLKTPQQFFDGIVDSVSNLNEQFGRFFKDLSSSKVLDTIGEKTSGITSFIKGLAEALQNLMAKLTPAKILVTGFGVALIATMMSITKTFEAFAGIANSLSGMFTGVTGIFESIQERIKPNKLQAISTSLLMLAGALFVVSLIPKDKLLGAVGAMTGLMVSLTAMVAGFAAIQKFLLKSKDIGKTLVQVSALMLSIAVSITILSIAMNALAAIPFEKVAAPLLLLGTVMVAMVTAMKVLSKNAPELSKNALTLVAFALAIKIVVSSLSDLSGMDFTSIVGSLIAVVTVMGLLSAISLLTKNVKFSNAAGFTLMIFDLLILAQVLKMLSKTDPEKLIKGVMAFIGLMGALIGLALISKLAGNEAAKMGTGLITMSAAIIILGVAIKNIGSLDLGTVVKGTVVVSAIIALFGGLMVLSNAIKGNSGKMSATFLGISAAILILGVAIEYIGGMSLSTISKGTVVVAALLAMFGLLMVASSQIGQAKGTLIVMGVVIGALVASLTLLTLVPFDEALKSVVVLGSILLAFGGTMKMIGNTKFKTGLASVLVMLAVITGIKEVFSVMDGMETESLIAKSASIGAIMLSLGATLKMISTIKGDSKVAINAIVGTGAVLAAATIVLILLDAMPFSEGLLEKAASLSLMMAAISGVMLALGAMKTSGTDSVKNAAAFAIVSTVVVGLIAGIGLISAAFDSEGVFADYGVGFMAKLTPLIPIILTLAAVTAILGLVGGAAKSAGEGALGFAKVVLIITGVIAGVGAIAYALDSLGVDVEQVMEKAQTVFYGLANIIGGSLSRLITSFGTGITAGLAQMGEDLSSFAASAKPFFNAMGELDQDVLSGVVKMVEMMTLLTAGDLMNRILSFGTASPLSAFGDQLTEFGPKFAEFADSIKDIPVEQTTAAGECLVGLAQLLTAIPKEGGLLQDIMGGRSFEKFGEGLKDFAEGFAGYCEILATAPITKEIVQSTKYATDAIIELANKIPVSGGLLQGFFGEHDLGKFGTDLKTFGRSMADFFGIISEANIDYKLVETCAAAGESLATFANKVPAAGGLLQDFLGTQDIGVFGAQLVAFGEALRSFFLIMTTANINQELVTACVAAGEAFAEFSEKVPRMGGALEFFTGSKDMAQFGEQIKGFGEGLAAFFTAFKLVDVTEEDVLLANTAMDGFGRLAQSIGQTGGISSVWSSSSLAEFGKQIKGLGESLSSYYYEISAIDFDKVNLSIAAAESMLKITEGMDNTASTLTDKVKKVMNDIVKAAKEALGITGDYSSKFYEMGGQIVAGLKKGVDENESGLNSTMTSFGDAVANAFANAVGINSPSTVFANMGMYIVQGLEKGIIQYMNLAVTAVIRMGNRLVSAIKNFFGIHSPSTVMRDEVGRFIVDGIAEGIEENTSAEEAAAQKAQNIINAFKSVFDKFSLDATTADLEYQLWESANPNATEEELKQKNVELLGKKLKYQAEAVNLANLQYQATLKQLGEGAEETQQAYNTFLQEQISMNQLASELLDTLNETTEEGIDNAQAFRDLNSLLFDELEGGGNLYDSLKLQGFSDEEIMDYAAKETGWQKPTASVGVDFEIEGIGKIGGTVEEIVDQFVKSAEWSFDQSNLEFVFTNAMVTATESAGSAGSSGGSSAGSGAASGMAEGLAGGMPEVSDVMSDGLDEIVKMVEGKGEESGDAYTGGFADKIHDFFKSSGNKITGGVQTFFDWLNGKGRESGEKTGREYVDGTVMAIDDNSVYAQIAADQYARAIGSSGASAAAEEGTSGGTTYVASTVQAISENTVRAQMAADELHRKGGQAGKDAAAEEGASGGATYATSTAQAIDDNSAYVQMAADRMAISGGEKGKVTAKAKGVETGKDYTTSTAQGIDDNSLYAQMAADRMAMQTGTAGSKQMNAQGNAVGKTYDSSTAQGVTDNSGLVDFSVGQVISSAASKGKTKAKTSFEEVGAMIAQGMADGMAKHQGIVTDRATTLAATTQRAAEAILGINSPSRVFWQIGKYIDQGLANGILDEYGIVEGSIKKLTDGINDTEAVISPVVDLTNWNNGVDKIKNDMRGVLIWDAAGNLVPYGFNDTGTGGRWIKTDIATALAVRAGDAQLADWAYNHANLVSDVGKAQNVNMADQYTTVPGVNFTFNQNVNSPKTISSAEVYRETKNLFNNVKNMVQNRINLAGVLSSAARAGDKGN